MVFLATPSGLRLTPQASSGLLYQWGLREDDVLSAQLAYYGLRADEYDRDLYQDPGTTDRLELVLTKLAPTGRALELACGTGVWTESLATRVQSVTAIDGSPEMLALARQRLGDTPVTLVEDGFVRLAARRSVRHDLLCVLALPRTAQSFRVVLGDAA